MELEEEKYHFQIASIISENLIATAVLVPEVNVIKMQRVVVKEDFRNLNVGTEMMTFCKKFARDKMFNIIYFHARISAVNFYKKNGYLEIGDYFNEDEIPHLIM